MKPRRGFTLIELLLFVAIFTFIIGAFIEVLLASVGTQVQQSASNEAGQQGLQLEQQIQYYVQNARLIDMPVDASSITLILREFPPSFDPIRIRRIGSAAVLQESTTLHMTSNRVSLSSLSFTRHYNQNSTNSPYGTDSVSFSFTMSSVNGTQSSTQNFESSATVAVPVPKIALIQQANVQNNNATTTNISAAYSSVNETGDLLLAVVANQYSKSGSPSTVTLSDTFSNAWTQIASTSYPAYGEQVTLFAALNAINGSDAVTSTFSTSTANAALYLYEYRGASTSSSFDAWGTQTQTSTLSPTSPSVTPTSSVELIFGINLNCGPITAVPTAGTGFTLETSSTVSNNIQLSVEDMDQYVDGYVSAPWTFNAAASSTAMVATFK